MAPAQHFRILCLGLITLLSLSSCSSPEPGHWVELVPENTPFLIIPEEGGTFQSSLQEPYIPLFDDMSSAAIQMTSDLLEGRQELPLLAMLLYPDTSNEWQPVWITEAPNGFIQSIRNRYQRAFTQTQYIFGDHIVDILHVDDRSFYVVTAGAYTLVSEASLAIENMLRAFEGALPAITLDPDQIQAGTYVVNMPNLEQWIQQLAQVSYRPFLQNLFPGTHPFTVAASNPPQAGDKHLWSLSGQMEVDEESSILVKSVSGPASDLLLDRYISTNASAFSIMHHEPRVLYPGEPEIESSLDQRLADDNELYREISTTLDRELAFIAFAESGFQSSSEFNFLRRLKEPRQLRQLLNDLVNEELIQQEGNSWVIHSSVLGRLIGSELSPFANFYLTIQGEVAAISRSRSLVESVRTDYSRRRVYFYDDTYISIREQLPPAVSSFTFVNSPEFNSYLQPWLFPQNYLGALSSSLDILTITTTRTSEQSPLEVTFSSFAREVRDVPYQERWALPLSSSLSGPPVLANLSGASGNQIIFSTTHGSVYAIAQDGSMVTEVLTSPDRPSGPPVVYDWYGNNQKILMQAAGNKIYAWNEAGNPLPNFPVLLDEEITTPLLVEDVTRNGVAEMIVATADRNLHILNSRGDPVNGWPRSTNSVIRSQPILAQVGNQRSIFAFAENGLHSWNINGLRRQGFPVFIDSRFNGSPVVLDSHILGAAADGNLYAIGNDPLFADSLLATSAGDSLYTQSLNVSNGSLNGSPSIYEEEMIRVDEELVRETLILTQSSNGAVQIYNTDGELRFTQNMGQPGSDDLSPQILDIDGNGRQDVLALAASGRLYGWDLISGNRLYNLPTSGMSYPLFADLNSDRNFEIITETREGLRIWTIFRQSTEEITEQRK